MMQGIIDLHHDIFFFLILILVFVLRILVRALWHFHYKKNPIPQGIFYIIQFTFFLVSLPLIFHFILNIDLRCFIEVAQCDEGIGSPSAGAAEFHPFVQPHLEVPELHVLVPVLEHPLIPDDVRQSELYSRILTISFGQETPLSTLVDLVDNQMQIERRIEAALVDDGFHPIRVLMERSRIRGFLFSPQGRLLSPATLARHIRQIADNGTRESIPYRRILRAIRNYELFFR